MKFMQKNKDVNMTEGNIARLILAFTFPLIVGNFFQLLYNTVDAWVLGNYVSDEAFGAVGSLGAIINMILCVTQGMSVGASAVVSQFYGASDDKKVSTAVHTSVILTAVIGIVATVIGIVFTENLLDLIRIPEEMEDEATLYLKIYFGGILGVMLYNIFASILRSVGDSQTPFWALLLSSVINLVLDLVFVLCFGMAVEGVAIATVIAQFISVIFLAFKLMRANGPYRLSFKNIEYSSDILWTIVRIGLPSAIQLGITSFSNVFVQSYINNLGPSVVSGWSSHSKIDQFVLLPIQSISLAVTTFVGQNIGAGKIPRAKKGIITSIAMTWALILVLLIPLMLFAEPLTMFFNDDPEIVKCGAYLLRLISPFYIFITVNNIIAGALRGSGNTKAPTVILLFSFVVFRQCYLAVVNALGYGQELTVVAMAYPLGWIVATIILVIYYSFAKWENSRVTGDPGNRHGHHIHLLRHHTHN